MFSDQYIDKEENGKILVRCNTRVTSIFVCACVYCVCNICVNKRVDICVRLVFAYAGCLCIQDVVFNFLTTDDIHLNQIDAEDPEVS